MNKKSFKNEINNLLDKIKENYKALEKNEELTKTSLIMPFFAELGYDVFNPNEFYPEYTADFGIKKGEKVDYAVKIDEKVIMLIECKALGVDLKKHAAQLFRYYSVEKAKFAILTNGKEYRFYADFKMSNQMDEEPFFIFKLEKNSDIEIEYLEMFSKEKFNEKEIINKTEEFKYIRLLLKKLEKEFKKPSREFTKFMFKDIYEGKVTQSNINELQEMLKGTLDRFIGEKEVIEVKKETEKKEPEKEEIKEIEIAKEVKIEDIETREEKEEYILKRIKVILKSEDINLKPNKNDSVIIYRNFPRKILCRIRINQNENTILLPIERGIVKKVIIKSLDEIDNLKNEIKEIFKKYKE